MSRGLGDKRLVDVLGPEALPVLIEKARRQNAKTDQLLRDVMAEVNDQARQQAGAAQCAARRARLQNAGVLKAKG